MYEVRAPASVGRSSRGAALASVPRWLPYTLACVTFVGRPPLGRSVEPPTCSPAAPDPPAVPPPIALIKPTSRANSIVCIVSTYRVIAACSCIAAHFERPLTEPAVSARGSSARRGRGQKYFERKRRRYGNRLQHVQSGLVMTDSTYTHDDSPSAKYPRLSGPYERNASRGPTGADREYRATLGEWTARIRGEVTGNETPLRSAETGDVRWQAQRHQLTPRILA